MANRKTYRKPRIKQVKLVPQEAILGGCKLGLASGGKTSTCLLNIGQCTASDAGS